MMLCFTAAATQDGPAETVEIINQEILLDALHRTPEEVLTSGEFTASEYDQYLKTGHQNERVWVKWNLAQLPDQSALPVVFMDYPLAHYQSDLKDARLYLIYDGKVQASSSQLYTFDNVMLPLPTTVFNGPATLLLSFDTDLKDWPCIPKIGFEDAVRKSRNREIATTLIAGGFMGATILLSLFMYFQLRISLFIWFSICYSFGTLRAVIRHFPTTWHPEIDQFSVIISQVLFTGLLVTYYLFFRKLLSLRENLPRTDMLLRVVTILVALALPWQIHQAGFHTSCLSFFFSILFCVILLSALIRIIIRKAITPGWLPVAWLLTTSFYLAICLASFAMNSSAIKHLYRPALFVMCTETFLFGIYSTYQIKALKTENSESRWEALHSQLNPHFVFNVMNNLGGLNSVEKVDLISAEFSSFLRYLLTSRIKKTVPLSAELEALQHYAAIDNIRFEEEAHIQILVPEALGNEQVIPLILQPLLENALKHSRAQRISPDIQVTAKKTNRSLELQVINSGEWKNQSLAGGTSTGLKNLQERLKLFYGKKAKLIIESTKDMVFARITIQRKSQHLSEAQPLRSR